MKFIQLLNRYPRLGDFLLGCTALLGRSTGVSADIISDGRAIARAMPVEYGLGYIIWFIRFQLGVTLPGYNIFHLVSDSNRATVLETLAPKIGDYAVAKQYYLLAGPDAPDADFLQSLEAKLKQCLQPSGRRTGIKSRRFDTSAAFDSLKKIDAMLKGYGLRPFLVSGTLLGAVRDGQLIPGDYDLDIGIFANESDSPSLCQRLLAEDAFQSVYNLGHLIQVTDINGIVIDVFLHFEEDGKVWHGTDIHKWTNSCFTLNEFVLCGHTFFVPDSAELYLDENYGHWAQPVLFWDYSFDTPNREFFRNRKTACYLADRIIGEMGKASPSRHIVQTALEQLRLEFGLDLTHYIGKGPAADTQSTTAGNTVVTFGTFDLFHIGHLNILRRAAAFGNRLIVGVSSDALNQSKKGVSPVYCEEDRMSIVESIGCVDAVFLEESLELKRDYLLQQGADILVMGNDWEGKFDELSDICKVVYLPRTDNISTSETKDSIKRNL